MFNSPGIWQYCGAGAGAGGGGIIIITTNVTQ